MLSSCFSTSQRTVTPTPTIQAPTLRPALQGLYEACSPNKGGICLERLDQMANAGFKLVINYDQFNGTDYQQLAYAHQAQMLGMKIIWSFSDAAFWNGTNLLHYYADLSATCNCSNDIGFISYAIKLIKNLPATWGYYVGDEVKKQDHDRMKALADLVKQLDPSHPRLFISSEDTTTMGANLIPFVDTTEVIGADVYPITNNAQKINDVGKIARAIQTIANRYHKVSTMVLQAFSWGEYPDATWACSPFPKCARFPTKNEMQLMRDLVINNAQVQFILWYSFFDIVNSPVSAVHFTDLAQAARSNLQS